MLIKLLLVTLFSICLAAIFTVTASIILHGTILFGVKIVGNAEGNLLFLVFVSTFLISATAMVLTFLKGDTLAERQRKAQDRAQARAKRVAVKQQQQQQKKVQKKTRAAMDKAARDERQRKAQDRAQARAKRVAVKQQQQQQKKVQKKTRAAMDKAARDELDRAMEGIDEFKITDEQKVAEGEATSERLKDAIRGEDGQKDEAGADVIDTDTGAATESLSPHAEKQKASMMKLDTAENLFISVDL